ncbi:MAG: hypothetical protein ACRYG7_03600 [Janthinobacterium lividum]
MLFASEIGTAKDNLLSPVHNWYKFTAGFSYKLINELVLSEKIGNTNPIFDPFAGCGTTLVSAQKLGIKAYGNEAQALMYEIISAKLEWSCERSIVSDILDKICSSIELFKARKGKSEGIHPLLITLYEEVDLDDLYYLRNYLLSNIQDNKYQSFFKLALAQTLHKVSSVPIAAPYIIRGKAKARNDMTVFAIFKSIAINMCNDLDTLPHLNKTSNVYLQDSREENLSIGINECDYCITSPPYLNNLDYGEISKVHTHFFNITDDWSDITTKVRKKLVTGSTTHYKKSDFNFVQWKDSMPFNDNPALGQQLTELHDIIKSVSESKTGRKSFNILMCLYFYDMLAVLKETRRILKPNGKAFLVLGDSAPYGELVPTTEIMGQLATSVGFEQFKIYKLRDRGSKWKNLKYRHSVEVAENILKIW